MIEIRVFGNPSPQGSKKFVGMRKGHAVMIEDSKYSRPWRETVKWATRDACGATVMQGPVDVEMAFTMLKPQSAPKRRVTYPDRTPDLDKLCRLVFDALTQGGAIEDDARVVRLTASKVYPNEGVDALHIPGAVIRIRPHANDN